MKSIRYPELDALRGLAVVLMVTYHFFFDLSYFYGFDIPIMHGWWNLFARGTASLFLLVIGICSVISWERTVPTQRWKKTLRRAGIIIAGGMIASLATWFVSPHAFIKFGVLHLIGVSALIQPLFVRLKKWNLLTGLVMLYLGFQLASVSTDSSLLFPFGFTYPGFASLDYYPLLPWFGVILIGMAIGEWLYVPVRKVRLSLPYPQWLLWTGKRALLIYALQQPVLLLILSLFLGFPSR